MTKNPLINALTATTYIALIVFVMDFGTRIASRPNTFIAPLAVVSLFTLSAAVMGYVFGYEPAQLYFDGKKKAAVNLFLQTVAIFAGITILFLVLLFSGFLNSK